MKRTLMPKITHTLYLSGLFVSCQAERSRVCVRP